MSFYKAGTSENIYPEDRPVKKERSPGRTAGVAGKGKELKMLIDDIKQCIKRVRVAADLNYPVYLTEKNGSFLRPFCILYQIISVLFYRFVGRRMEYFVNERIVEIPFVFKNLGRITGGKVLDFGNNDSLFTFHLASTGFKVTGADLFEYGFNHPNIEFKKGDFLKNEFEQGSYDAALAISALEHVGLKAYRSDLYKNGDLAVSAKVRTLLKPGGIFIITMPYGTEHEDNFLRIYDKKRVELLIKDFTVAEKRFYIRDHAMGNWHEADEETAGKVRYSRNRGVDCVICLACIAS